jgi:hypothetical protein
VGFNRNSPAQIAAKATILKQRKNQALNVRYRLENTANTLAPRPMLKSEHDVTNPAITAVSVRGCIKTPDSHATTATTVKIPASRPMRGDRLGRSVCAVMAVLSILT